MTALELIGLIAIIFGAVLFVQYYVFKQPLTELQLPETTTEGYHVGPLKIYNYVYWTYDDSAQSSNVPTVKFYHADKKNLMGTISSNSLTSQLLETDKDIVYMSADHGTNTGYFVDPETTVARGTPYVKDWFPWDYDQDGTLEYGFTVNMKALPNLAAGQQQWEATINLYVYKVETTPDLASITNATTISTTAAGDYYTTMYVSSFTGEGYATKLAYITFTTANSGTNATYLTNGTLTLKDIQIITNKGASYSISGTTIGTFDESTNKSKIYPISDYLNEVNDITIYNWRGGGGSGNLVTFHWYVGTGGWPGGNHRILITITFAFIGADGTISTYTQVVELRNSY